MLLKVLLWTLITISHASSESLSKINCPPLLEKCTCTKSTIECIDTNFSNTDIFLQFKKHMPDVTKITITGNNFTSLNVNLFGNCSMTENFHGLLHLRVLDLSCNNIHIIHGKTFHCVPQLEALILDHNEWRPDNSHYRVFTDLYDMKNLSLKNAFLESTNGHHHLSRLSQMLNISDPDSEPGLNKLEYLNLASNEFWTLRNVTTEALCRFKNLKVLDLSDNNLGSADISACTTKLEVLDLSKNRIIYFSTYLMNVLDKLTNLRHVSLGNNDYDCNCHAKEFHNWLGKTKVPIDDRESITCKLGYYSTYQGQRLDTIPVGKLLCKDNHHDSTGTYVILSLIFAAVFVFIIALMFCNRVEIKNLWLRCRSNSPDWLIMMGRGHAEYSTVQSVATF